MDCREQLYDEAYLASDFFNKVKLLWKVGNPGVKLWKLDRVKWNETPLIKHAFPHCKSCLSLTFSQVVVGRKYGE